MEISGKANTDRTAAIQPKMATITMEDVLYEFRMYPVDALRADSAGNRALLIADGITSNLAMTSKTLPYIATASRDRYAATTKRSMCINTGLTNPLTDAHPP